MPSEFNGLAKLQKRPARDFRSHARDHPARPFRILLGGYFTLPYVILSLDEAVMLPQDL